MWDSANNPLSLARFELKRFRGPLPRLALGFILLIPLLYGCIYLAGNWDPYGRRDQVPVGSGHCPPIEEINSATRLRDWREGHDSPDARR